MSKVNNDDATVSIAMATYNGEQYLETQLQSILQQTRVPDQIVIVDDASTDSTPAIIADFKIKYPALFLFASNIENMGPQKSFEKAISLTTSRHIALCDQDDVWKPNKIEILSGILQRYPQALMVFHDMEIINPFGRLRADSFWSVAPGNEPLPVVGSDARERICRLSNPVPGCSMLFSSALKSRLLPIPKYNIGHDWWISATAFFWGNPLFTEEKLSQYRRHPMQAAGIGTTLIPEPSEKQAISWRTRVVRESKRILLGPIIKKQQRKELYDRRKRMTQCLISLIDACIKERLPQPDLPEYISLRSKLEEIG